MSLSISPTHLAHTAPDPVNVLIVDDRASNLVALQAFLGNEDYNVITAASGAEALVLLTMHEVAVILTDIMMPTMDGFEFVTRVKQHEELQEIPIIFLTAMESKVVDIFRGYEVGAVDYLQKPLEPEIVKAKVAIFVRIFRQNRLIRRQAAELIANEREAQSRRVAELQRQAAEERRRAEEILSEIAKERQVEQIQATQLGVTKILAGSAPVEEAVPLLLKTVARGLKWGWAALWVLDTGGAGLKVSATWHDGSDATARLADASCALMLRPGEGLPGIVWNRDAPLWLEGDVVDARFAGEVPEPGETYGAVALPISVNGKLTAVAEFASLRHTPKDRQILSMLIEIGSRVGLYMQRKIAEETLRESEEKFRLLVAGVQDYAIVKLDPDGLVTTWNDGAQRIKGYSEAEIIGQSFACFYTPEAVKAGQPEHDLEVAKTNGRHEEEGERVRKDGTRFWAQSLITALYDGKGTLRGFAKITRDITERKCAEQELRRNNEDLEWRVEERTREVRRSATQLRIITNAIPVMVAELDAEQRFLFANDAYRQWYAGRSQDIIGLTLKELVSADGYAQIAHHVAEVLDGKVVAFEREVSRQGSTQHFGVVHIPEFDEERTVTGFIIVATDITKHKKIEEELRLAKVSADAASAAKSAFLANMSHEIRTPLGAVLGFSELMLHADLAPTERAEYLSAMKRNGDLLSKLIDDILDLSKVEAGKLDIERQGVRVRETIEDIEKLLRLRAQEKLIELSVRTDPDVPSVIKTDPIRLRQILLNIIGNAIKFTNIGAVSVHVKPLKTGSGAMKLAFVVTDTGPGISPEVAARLFEPFTQADVSTRRRHGGTGLGLVLSRHLATVLGGDVVLNESQPGIGSMFTITIDPGPPPPPGVQPNKVSRRSPATAGRAQDIRLDGANVLLVEDAPDNRMLVGRYLRVAGATVDMAENGREALEKVHRRQYDAVLMDLQMPEMDGYEATATLRREGNRTPIIALTAHALHEERQRCLTAGFDDHICKPIDRVELLKRLARHAGAAVPRPKFNA